MNFYQKFVTNYAHIVAPLSALLRKNVEWAWGEAQQKAFDTVIKRLVESTTLAYPDINKPFYVHTDASDTATGVHCLRKMKKENCDSSRAGARNLMPQKQITLHTNENFWHWSKR
jgi:hypothetical protein